jgi:hypothetical protein
MSKVEELKLRCQKIEVARHRQEEDEKDFLRQLRKVEDAEHQEKKWFEAEKKAEAERKREAVWRLAEERKFKVDAEEMRKEKEEQWRLGEKHEGKVSGTAVCSSGFIDFRNSEKPLRSWRMMWNPQV